MMHNPSHVLAHSSLVLPPKSEALWYVCRYRNLTNDIRHLKVDEDEDIEFFFPMIEANKGSEAQKKRSNRPVLSGFIFVKGQLETIKRSPSFSRFYLMRTHGETPRYITITEGDMQPFMQVAAILSENPELIYTEEFDQSTYNIVEFGDENPQFAFLETSQGKRGGTLIVPFRQEDFLRWKFAGYSNPNFVLPKGVLCYKIPTDQVPFRVIRICQGNKYDLDYVNAASKVATAAILSHTHGIPVPQKTRIRLREFLYRYTDACTANIKLQTKINITRYQCCIVLRQTDACKRLQMVLHDNLLHYSQYVEGVTKVHRQKTKATFDTIKNSYDQLNTLAEVILSPHHTEHLT